MSKKKKLAPMAGEQDSAFGFRIPTTLHERFNASVRAGGVKISGADALRGFMELRCEFTEKNGRQPHSLDELCAWHLAQQKKKK